MHEGGLLHAAVAELIDHAGAQPVSRVHVAIGPGVDRAAAEAAWAHAAAGTSVEHATVAWTEALDVLCCLDCSNSYPGRRLDRCPRCGGNGLVVDPAPELALEEWS